MELYYKVLQLILEIIVFLILMVFIEFASKKLRNSNHRALNPKEYLPEEEIHTLKQIFYLIMMALIFIDIMYSIIFLQGDNLYLALFDIILSLYLATRLDKDCLKNRILFLLLIPFGSMTFIIFGTSLVGVMDLIHVPVLAYFIKVYLDRFREYTTANGLGIAILLLFTIIFASFLLTQVAENVNPLDSLVMVSNAFTSNGYTVLGSTIAGKLNSIILVWGGYVLSGVGTATLTAGILTRYHNRKYKKLNRKFEDLDEKLENIEKIVKNKDN